ncbi:MAG TPA: hypothetical protein VNA22_08500 [Pyrinomonadaceae bacterium]|nr:hypothetical protein [Pyrinomonadaceae bacterium]
MKQVNSRALNDQNGEEGAALVMALLISALLMVASAGLILETTTNTYNVTDMTSEQQAYNAAESGIQAAVNVLRDNITLADDERLDTTVPATAKPNRINYLKALELGDSNASDDTATVPRLSRWIDYDDTQVDRVVMGGSGNYGYKLELSDPDHTGALVTYNTSGKFHSTNSNQIVEGNAVNGLRIRILPQASIEIDTSVAAGGTPANFGTFEVTRTNNGAQVSIPVRFEIVVRMTHPYMGVRVIRGYIMPNTQTNGVWTLPDVITDSKLFTLQGSVVELLAIGGNSIPGTFSLGPPPGYRTQLAPIVTSGTPVNNVISGTISSPEPVRLLIRSTGYGPRGASKQLEAIIQKNFFNSLNAPATLTLIGPSQTTSCATCVPAVPQTSTTFNPGSSTVTTYSGQDQSSLNDIIPPIGTNDPANLNLVTDSVDGEPPHPFNGDVIGVPSDISVDVPFWLSSTQTLDATMKSLYNVASSAGRYFPSGVQPTSIGNPSTGQGITFCDGDCTLNMDGGGILIVTGQLTVTGNFTFKGLIIVTGKEGVTRTGGGTGRILGNMVIAPYVNSGVLPASEPAGLWLAPQYDLSGGGNAEISFDSTAFNDSLLAVDNFILGVVEK